MAARGDTIPQLSCQLCRDRKVKCDKQNPCANCRRIGATCVSVRRKRLPRGRPVHRLASDENIRNLRDRVERLETLLTNAATADDETSAIASASRVYDRVQMLCFVFANAS